jgi:hypothetical protein
MFKSYTELLMGSENNNSETNECLFSDICPTGYFSKAELVHHLNTISADPKLKWQAKHLEILFSFFKLGGILSREPQHSTEAGKGITWLKVTTGKVSKPIKIMHFAEVKQLIDDYANGILKVNHTLEELYNEALN